jgi:ribosomal protein S27AE
VISLDAIQLRTIAADVLKTLHVNDSVAVLDVHDMSDGAWSIDFEDRWPDTRFPTFVIEIPQEWSREGAARELRAVLREKLWICPRCQRRAWMRRLVDANVFRVECGQCGRYEIDSEELKRAGS